MWWCHCVYNCVFVNKQLKARKRPVVKSLKLCIIMFWNCFNSCKCTWIQSTHTWLCQNCRTLGWQPLFTQRPTSLKSSGISSSSSFLTTFSSVVIEISSSFWWCVFSRSRRLVVWPWTFSMKVPTMSARLRSKSFVASYDNRTTGCELMYHGHR